MQAELKINRRADKNDLMVINRLEALHQLITMQNSKQREQTCTLLISVFLQLISSKFHCHISGEIYLERLRTTELPNAAEEQRKDSQ